MNEKKARAIVYERSGHVCEMCSRARATEAHHRKNRSQGGLWSPENLLHLCPSCHRHVGLNPAASRDQGWSVGRNFNPAEVPVWIAGRGRVFLTADGGITPTEKRAA